MHVAESLIAYITAHPDMALYVIALCAFGESFAFASLLFPGTAILIAAGALIKGHAIEPFPAAAAGSLGAICGDAISFWIGQQFGPRLPQMWPFRRHPKLLPRSQDFFRRYGWPSVFIGRFFGPLRAVVPVAAGMAKMPTIPFYIANCLSAFVWAPALLLFGFALAHGFVTWLHL